MLIIAKFHIFLVVMSLGVFICLFVITPQVMNKPL